jgi:hypothetical protein
MSTDGYWIVLFSLVIGNVKSQNQGHNDSTDKSLFAECYFFYLWK